MATYPNHLPDIDTLPDSALLRMSTIIALVQCSRSSWFAWVKSGRAPQGVRIGPMAVAWRAGDVRAFMRGQPRGEAPEYTVVGGKAGRAKQLATKAAKAALLGVV